ncbi:MAG: formylglycine-generating enzyme family protein [Treponema sp.]|nr:formylglycine-generating enzyme family protein [Treponema sp.]MCL2251589.1 formylglycine-generating enzyme family protein [Treponema sp.]
MKRNVMFRFLGIITIVVIMGFVFIGCNEGDKGCSHIYGGDLITEPTCTEEGYTTQTCSKCIETQTINPIPKIATEHNWGGDAATSPTCTEEGYTTQTCSNCFTTQEINQTAALQHAWGEDVVKEPTCTEEGFTTQTCSKCSLTQIINQITATGHNWNEWNVITVPTCTTTGIGTRYCSVCDKLDPSGVIPALEHDYQETLAPTCTTIERGTCNRNSAHTVSINALGHDWSGSWSTIGDVYTTCQRDTCTYALDKYEMAAIPNGNLVWESAVIILSAFNMGKYEVTQELYEAVMGINPSYFQGGGTGIVPATGEVQSKRPVENVSWFDAIGFCNKLSTKEGLTPVYTITEYPATVTPNWEANGYRLPTDAQWEYACRAGTTTRWYFGDTESQLVYYAWYSENSNNRTHQIGLKQANSWGLYDMHGNVEEWCWDQYGPLPTTNQINYTGAVSGGYRVWRGGSWSDSVRFIHPGRRTHGYSSNGRYNTIGFRVVRP